MIEYAYEKGWEEKRRTDKQLEIESAILLDADSNPVGCRIKYFYYKAQKPKKGKSYPDYLYLERSFFYDLNDDLVGVRGVFFEPFKVEEETGAEYEIRKALEQEQAILRADKARMREEKFSESRRLRILKDREEFERVKEEQEEARRSDQENLSVERAVRREKREARRCQKAKNRATFDAWLLEERKERRKEREKRRNNKKLDLQKRGNWERRQRLLDKQKKIEDLLSQFE